MASKVKKAPSGASAPKTKGLKSIPLINSIIPSRGTTPTAGADVAYFRDFSPDLQISGNMTDKLRVRVFQRLCNVGVGITGESGVQVSGFLAYANTDGTTYSGNTCISTIGFNPVRCLGLVDAPNPASYYSADVLPDGALLPLLAMNFTRYRMVGKLQLCYQPLAPTSSTTYFALAVVDDPMHPMLGIPAYTSGAYPDTSMVKAMPHSASFPGWFPWERFWDVDNSLHYVFAPKHANVTPLIGERFNVPWTVTCLGNAVESIKTVRGQLWFGCEIEFSSPAPLVRLSDVALSAVYRSFSGGGDNVSCGMRRVLPVTRTEERGLSDEGKEERSSEYDIVIPGGSLPPPSSLTLVAVPSGSGSTSSASGPASTGLVKPVLTRR